jgi:hypothetical protein
MRALVLASAVVLVGLLASGCEMLQDDLDDSEHDPRSWAPVTGEEAVAVLHRTVDAALQHQWDQFCDYPATYPHAPGCEPTEQDRKDGELAADAIATAPSQRPEILREEVVAATECTPPGYALYLRGTDGAGAEYTSTFVVTRAPEGDLMTIIQVFWRSTGVDLPDSGWCQPA